MFFFRGLEEEEDLEGFLLRVTPERSMVSFLQRAGSSIPEDMEK